MGMRSYQPIHISPMLDPVHRNELLKVDKFLRQISANMARTPQAAQGTPAAGGGSVDLSNYLFLPGKPLPGQFAKERVTFDMKSGDEISSTDDVDIRGLTLRSVSSSGGIYFKHDVYFSAEGAGANIVRRWIFPNFSASVSDNRVFASTSGTQELSGKTLVSGVIHVGSNAARNVFRDTTSGTKEFLITTASGFPTTAVQQPALQLPALDTSTAEHSFVILHSNASEPFPPGSILYGNSAGTEMEDLANGTVGQVLSSGGTTVAPTWATIGSSSATSSFRDDLFNVFGSADATKKAMFEVDGFTTATTRTFTLPDVSTTLLGRQGTSGGQIIGTGTHTSGAASSLVIEDRLMVGVASGVAFSSGRVLDARLNMANAGTFINLIPSIAGLSGTATGTLVGMNLSNTGTAGYTAGSFFLRGFNFTWTQNVPSGVTLFEGIGGEFKVSISTNAGTVADLVGLRATIEGSTTASSTIDNIRLMKMTINPRSSAITSLAAFTLGNVAFAGTGALGRFRGLDISDLDAGMAFDDAAVTDWTGIYMAAVTNPVGTIRGLDIAVGNNLLGSTTFTGDVAHDGFNISTDATTGTQIGTANTQLLSLWGAATIAQPTAAIAAAVFVANTSLIANDTATFDGYTIGQVVKALRNFGLLA